MYVNQINCTYVSLSVFLTVCMYVCQLICSHVCMNCNSFVCFFVRLSILSVYMFASPSVCLYAHLFVCLFKCLSVCLCLYRIKIFSKSLNFKKWWRDIWSTVISHIYNHFRLQCARCKFKCVRPSLNVCYDVVEKL